MKEIYLISVLGNLNTLLLAVFCVLELFAFFSTIIVINEEDMPKEDKAKWYKRTSKCAIAGVIAMLLCVFLPSKKDMYLIYGVGTAIDYVKSNDTAKQLPDKVINALDLWTESLTKKEK